MKINIFNISKVITRLDTMIENAINGQNTDTAYDETKMSALESKLNRYLAMSKSKTHIQAEEKNKISSLISDISHQTKTPISNIMLYSQLLSEQTNLDLQSRKLSQEISVQLEKLRITLHCIDYMYIHSGIISKIS